MSIQQIKLSTHVDFFDDETLLFQCKGNAPAGSGQIYLTNYRFIFDGKKSLGRGVSMPSGVFGLAFSAVSAVKNLAQRSKEKDIIFIEMEYTILERMEIKGRFSKKLIVQVQGKGVEFEISNKDAEKIEVIIFDVDSGSIKTSYSSDLLQSYTQKGLSPRKMEQKYPKASPTTTKNYQKLNDDLEEINLRFEIGEFSQEEFKFLSNEIELQLPYVPENLVDEILLRLVIGEFTKEEFLSITGRKPEYYGQF